MDFARQQRDPTRHVIGISFVILVHVLVIWALLTGLGSQVVKIIKKPLTATIIKEIKLPPPPPPPPPPPKRVVEPPKVVEQPYVPPPEVQVPTPTTPPVIAAPVATPPTAPVVIAPPAPPAPPAPAKPAIRKGVTCSKQDQPTFPREAIRAQIQKGRVVAILTIDGKGNVSNVDIIESSPPRVFNRTVTDTLSGWKCAAEGEPYKASVEVDFTLKD